MFVVLYQGSRNPRGPSWTPKWATDKHKFTAWLEVNWTFGSREITTLVSSRHICPPPPPHLITVGSYWFDMIECYFDRSNPILVELKRRVLQAMQAALADIRSEITLFWGHFESNIVNFWVRMEEEELTIENWGFRISNWGWRAMHWG